MDDYDILFENGNTIRAIERNDTATHAYEFHGWDTTYTTTNTLDTDATEYYTLTVEPGRYATEWGEHATPDRVNVYPAHGRTITFDMNGFTFNADGDGNVRITPIEANKYSELVIEADDQPDLEDEKGGALDDFLDEFSERKQQV